MNYARTIVFAQILQETDAVSLSIIYGTTTFPERMFATSRDSNRIKFSLICIIIFTINENFYL